MNSRWGIVIVAFNPDLNKICKNLTSYSKLTSGVVVVNNGDDIDEDIIEGITIINLHSNVGIAAAQNIGVDFLASKKYKFSFFFDQDSNINDDYFENMLLELDRLKSNNDRIGILAPNVVDINVNRVLPFYYLINDKVLKGKVKKVDDVYYNSLPISSGILVEVNIYKKINGMNEKYFIDWVDIDFDLRMYKSNYQTVISGSNTIYHEIGKTVPKKIFGKKIYPSNHSLMREFYYARNGMYILKNHGGIQGLKKIVIKRICFRLLSSIYEPKPIKRIFTICKGIIFGIFTKSTGNIAVGK